VQGKVFRKGEYAFVKNGDTKGPSWVCKILEIRAESQLHVYLRVAWMYWPDELPGGRRDYHGELELVASNHQEIIDALTIEDLAVVTALDEKDESAEVEGLFWRQQFDYPHKKLLVSGCRIWDIYSMY
jgi:BAH domain